MKSEHGLFNKVRFSISVCALYVLTIGFAWYGLQTPVAEAAVRTVEKSSPAPTPVTKPKFNLIQGKPVRLVIKDSGIDLPVDEGRYQKDGSWTLSDSHVQYAMLSTLANNHSGNTFIYGHGTYAVLGKLAITTPKPKSKALVYTGNGHIFSYRFDKKKDLSPTNTSIFDYDGPPILTIQTCTGFVSEYRTFFQYKFEKVVE